jgi:hypothetical protein
MIVHMMQNMDLPVIAGAMADSNRILDQGLPGEAEAGRGSGSGPG